MERAFLKEVRNEWRAVGGRWCEGGKGSCLGRPLASARRRMRHARLQPALGDGKEPGGFAGCKGFVETEYAAVAAVTLGSMDREGGAEAATVGRVCRGRDDVWAHGNGGLGNLIHSGSQAGEGLREHRGTRSAAARQIDRATKVAKGGLPGADGRFPASVAVMARVRHQDCNKGHYITIENLKVN